MLTAGSSRPRPGIDDWKEFYMSVAAILTKFDDVLYTWCLIYMLAGTGIYFTIRTRFVQLRLLKDCFMCMLLLISVEE